MIRIFLTLGVIVAVVGAVAYWQLDMKENTARDAASRFAAALVDNDPAAAPSGGHDYVRGVRAYFGPVKDARVIGSHTESFRQMNTTHSFAVADVFLRAERGPAVIEVEFDDGSLLDSEEITKVHEINPYAASGLAAAERKQLASAYLARDGDLADQKALSGTGAPPRPTPAPAEAWPVPSSGSRPGLDRAEQVLRCVQRAAGDPAKLQRCARS
jgi:hypothetical protein